MAFDPANQGAVRALDLARAKREAERKALQPALPALMQRLEASPWGVDSGGVDARLAASTSLPHQAAEIERSPGAPEARKGFQAVANHDWPVAIAWYQMDEATWNLKRTLEMAVAMNRSDLALTVAAIYPDGDYAATQLRRLAGKTDAATGKCIGLFLRELSDGRDPLPVLQERHVLALVEKAREAQDSAETYARIPKDLDQLVKMMPEQLPENLASDAGVQFIAALAARLE